MKRSKHSLSHYKLLSCGMGGLYPIGCVEVLPGDSIRHGISALVRMQPMLAPIMHPVHVRIHNWYVPYRLVWDDWEEFITGGEDGMNNSTFPTITFTTVSKGDLADYMGVPIGSNLEVSALPFRAYDLIWNENYRDQDLQTKLTIDTTDGADTTTSTVLKNVNWEKDRFTSARPWEQKGTEITIPLAGEAPVEYKSGNDTNANKVRAAATGALLTAAASGALGTSTSGSGNFEESSLGTPEAHLDLGDTHIANLAQATGLSVVEFRESIAKARYQEARARYGSRYTEYLRYLGIRSSDARLQRPEYVSGGKQTLQFSEVLQTSNDGTNDFVGTMRGHGISALRSRRYVRFFEEHGVLLSLMSIKPKSMYASGIPRQFNRRTKEDFWQKELQHVGQQEIQNKEVYAAAATPDGTFGYQDRYDEYRRQESSVAGEFRTTDLNFWHFARLFGSEPALNSDFVECDPTTRTFASTATDTMLVMAMHSMQARRLVAKTGSSYTF